MGPSSPQREAFGAAAGPLGPVVGGQFPPVNAGPAPYPQPFSKSMMFSNDFCITIDCALNRLCIK